MHTYRYTAETEQGEQTVGVIEASSMDDALEILLDRGLRNVQVYLLPGKPDSAKLPDAPVVLNEQEASELSQHVAQVTTAQVPLAAGLRAAAEEAGPTRVATALNWIAGQIEQGSTLEETLAQSNRMLPPHVRGLILAAAETGQLGDALFELVELQQRTYALRREVASGYVYPLLVVGLTVTILLACIAFLTGVMARLMCDFGLQLPLISRLLYWWRDTGFWILAGIAAVIVFLAIVYRVTAGPAKWRSFVATLPLFGPLWHWTGIAEWSGLLSVLLRHQVPLPEALRYAGHGSRDANVEAMSLRLADGVARGRPLSQSMHTMAQLPSSLVPLVEWGESSGELADSFRVGQEMFEKRTRMRAVLLQSIIPPLLFLGIGCIAIFVIMANFAPMINLVSSLS